MNTNATTQTIKSAVFCGNVDLVDWLRIRIEHHFKKNPNKDESGLWLVVCWNNGKKQILAEGTKKHCDDYVNKSRQEYAEKHRVELMGRIEELLTQARAKAKECSSEKALSLQQALVERVHSLTREAIKLASWFNNSYTDDVKWIASNIRKDTKLTYCGEKLWNIIISATTEEKVLCRISMAKAVVVEAIEKKNGTPKFVTHQVMCDGEVIAEGSDKACKIFVEISSEAVAAIKKAEERRLAQEEWEDERRGIEQQLLEALDNIETRLQNGEHFAGDIQKIVREILVTANTYKLDSVISRANNIMRKTILRFSSPLPIGASVGSSVGASAVTVGV